MSTIVAYGNRVLIKPDKSFEKVLDSGIVVVGTNRHGYLISGEIVGCHADEQDVKLGTTVYYYVSDAKFLDTDGTTTLHVLDISDVYAYKIKD